MSSRARRIWSRICRESATSGPILSSSEPIVITHDSDHFAPVYMGSGAVTAEDLAETRQRYDELRHSIPSLKTSLEQQECKSEREQVQELRGRLEKEIKLMHKHTADFLAKSDVVILSKFDFHVWVKRKPNPLIPMNKRILVALTHAQFRNVLVHRMTIYGGRILANWEENRIHALNSIAPDSYENVKVYGMPGYEEDGPPVEPHDTEVSKLGFYNCKHKKKWMRRHKQHTGRHILRRTASLPALRHNGHTLLGPPSDQHSDTPSARP
ncbi:uncharacterized protein EV422DRAFT_69299 [Fimicolochytrium jonesii]|uniref:uncharacterized protein n=1 Tax=Fimicolochytrium jonesii TaxID=1396493 RepID=UPI0022FED592|nr:uncharacterized protein EV422DRAFT_69299 [Fimicolochytrium jonesii]KAI8820402.1 hypothetical protein EV422DRAFT_69299 [Fimicolochytrium jonesii]